MVNMIKKIYEYDDMINELETNIMFDAKTEEDVAYLNKRIKSLTQARNEWIDYVIKNLKEMKKM